MKKFFENKRVAVVGNAESLFGKNLGKVIDTYDVVCRFNLGCILKDWSQQGRHTHVYFLNVAATHKMTIRQLPQSAIIAHVSNKLRNHRNIPKNRFVHYIPQESNDELTEILDGIRPSSGLMVGHYLMKCNPTEVGFFGFDFKATKTYYQTTKIHMGPHDFDKERDYMMNTILKTPNFTLF